MNEDRRDSVCCRLPSRSLCFLQPTIHLSNTTRYTLSRRDHPIVSLEQLSLWSRHWIVNSLKKIFPLNRRSFRVLYSLLFEFVELSPLLFCVLGLKGRGLLENEVGIHFFIPPLGPSLGVTRVMLMTVRTQWTRPTVVRSCLDPRGSCALYVASEQCARFRICTAGAPGLPRRNRHAVAAGLRKHAKSDSPCQLVPVREGITASTHCRRVPVSRPRRCHVFCFLCASAAVDF